MTWFVGMLIGIIIGLVGGVLIDRDTVNKILVRKIKQKGNKGESDISVPISLDSSNMKSRRDRVDRLRDRLERKKAKELKRIEKNLL